MGFSKKARIITLLVIDTVFFFIELFFGYAVGSIALVAGEQQPQPDRAAPAA